MMYIDDILELIKDLAKHNLLIANSLATDEDSDVNDWCRLCRLGDMLVALHHLILAEKLFGNALYGEMEKMKTSEEDSKWTFPVEKAFNDFAKNILFNDLEQILNFSRSWKFKDYRARNFQNELRQKMEKVRDEYKERFEL